VRVLGGVCGHDCHSKNNDGITNFNILLLISRFITYWTGGVFSLFSQKNNRHL
jgi:hypothetical protein